MLLGSEAQGTFTGTFAFVGWRALPPELADETEPVVPGQGVWTAWTHRWWVLRLMAASAPSIPSPDRCSRSSSCVPSTVLGMGDREERQRKWKKR